MALIVQKYGGTSVATIDKIRRVAKHIVNSKEKGDDILVVVSAMGGETNRLIELSRSIMDPPDERELDVITSSGEQVSSGLLTMMIKSMGYDAISFQGHQVRIITDNAHSKARIVRIDDEKIKKSTHRGQDHSGCRISGRRGGR